MASPAAQTPGAGGDGDDEEQQGKGEKKWKASYKHMIKGIPGALHVSTLHAQLHARSVAQGNIQ